MERFWNNFRWEKEEGLWVRNSRYERRGRFMGEKIYKNFSLEDKKKLVREKNREK